jgi:DNA-directed RNA polymerase subunit L
MIQNIEEITNEQIQKLEKENRELRNMIRRLLGTLKGLQVICASYNMNNMVNECKRNHSEESLKFIKITGERND